MNATQTTAKQACYHCGEDCTSEKVIWQEKQFCCLGCKMVFQLLDKNGLCEYYNLNEKPGTSQRIAVRKNKFAFLEDENIQQRLTIFSDDLQTHIVLYLPQMHCSSCLYLLENLHKLNDAIISSTVNFSTKEVSIVFNPKKINLRRTAELLTSIGYEPYISLNDLKNKKPPVSKKMIYQLGVAGFCFGNIMLLSFPEYLGLEEAERNLQGVFRILNLILALPIFFYSAIPFFESGWNGLKNKFLNIDAPIALAILVTFGRSLYEVCTGTGAGYFDSMAGIVFFMLAGRVLQDKTYQHLSFERDYASYFPIAVTVVKEDKEIATALPDVKVGDTLRIHSEELIPADGILTRGTACIDYSFVTGESVPVNKEMGEIVYAGGKQTGGNIEILIIKEVAQSYLTSLWSKDQFKKSNATKSNSFVHALSRYFTYIVLSIATIGATYWAFNDSNKIWDVITAILIVACPCALLIANTFTNGNILRILARNKLYLRNAQAIEDIAGVTHVMFDKTGTLTNTHIHDIEYYGKPLSDRQKQIIRALATQSTHPFSKALSNHFENDRFLIVKRFRETPGKGIEAFVDDQQILLGSEQFITGKRTDRESSTVFIKFGDEVYGHFRFRNHYRTCIRDLVKSLSKNYALSVVSGDTSSDRAILHGITNNAVTVRFNQKPEDKLHFVEKLQTQGERVLMVGDGLNDAGALKQSNIGIAIAEDTNNFTPASDGIMDASQLEKLPLFIRLCNANHKIVMTSFAISILYNIIGIFFAVQGLLSPLIAAILMPASSFTILIVTYGSSNIAAKYLKL